MEIKRTRPFSPVNSKAVTSRTNIWPRERFVLSEEIGLMPEPAEQAAEELHTAFGSRAEL